MTPMMIATWIAENSGQWMNLVDALTLIVKPSDLRLMADDLVWAAKDLDDAAAKGE